MCSPFARTRAQWYFGFLLIAKFVWVFFICRIVSVCAHSIPMWHYYQPTLDNIHNVQLIITNVRIFFSYCYIYNIIIVRIQCICCNSQLLQIQSIFWIKSSLSISTYHVECAESNSCCYLWRILWMKNSMNQIEIIS